MDSFYISINLVLSFSRLTHFSLKRSTFGEFHFKFSFFSLLFCGKVHYQFIKQLHRDCLSSIAAHLSEFAYAFSKYFHCNAANNAICGGVGERKGEAENSRRCLQCQRIFFVIKEEWLADVWTFWRFDVFGRNFRNYPARNRFWSQNSCAVWTSNNTSSPNELKCAWVDLWNVVWCINSNVAIDYEHTRGQSEC